MEEVFAKNQLKPWKTAVRRNTYRGAWGGSFIALICLIISFKGYSSGFIDFMLMLSAIASTICAPIYAVINFRSEQWRALVPLLIISFVVMMHKFLWWALLMFFLSPFAWVWYLFY